jgi:hypothetical protein
MKLGFVLPGRLFAIGCLGVLVWGAVAIEARAQFPAPEIRYDRGQDVGPKFEGWMANPDGTFTMYFGYLNRNASEDVVIPIGPDNNFDMGDGDLGQPTYFHAGVHWWVFGVVVPSDWPRDQRLVWTLTSRGRTNEAKGWLQEEWEVDRALIIGNTGRDPFYRGGVSSANLVGNQPPSVSGDSSLTITLPETAAVSINVMDDGVPEPNPESRREPGIRTRWFVYRGPAAVQFSPETTEPVYERSVTAETEARFSEPGNYRLRALVMDGGDFTTYDINVAVNPAVSSGE